MLFNEKCASVSHIEETMAPGTQLVFLYLYYHTGHNRTMNQTELSKKLRPSKATCSRAIKDLAESGVIEIKMKVQISGLFPGLTNQNF